ncbi:MAG: GNAT family N-acetyltransferase [Acidisphaera sp.]|nr:GNAT family N-acetyltransferase [Acidisphaera sp.]
MNGTNIALRPLLAADLAAASRLSTALGWPHRLEDWALCLALGRGVAACDARGLAGTAMRWRWGDAAGTLGMVLVDPDRQRAGIGRRMLEALLAGDEPDRLMLNATEAGLGLYERLGFRATGAVRQHQGAFAGDAAAEAGDTRPALRAEWPALVALDRDAFGADRAPLLERLLADGAGIVCGPPGRPTGFTIRRPFGRGVLFGPLVAPGEAEAIALIAAGAGEGLHRVDIPAEASRLAGWLERSGLPAVDTVVTMVRGDWPAPPPGRRAFALATQAFG